MSRIGVITALSVSNAVLLLGVLYPVTMRRIGRRLRAAILKTIYGGGGGATREATEAVAAEDEAAAGAPAADEEATAKAVVAATAAAPSASASVLTGLSIRAHARPEG